MHWLGGASYITAVVVTVSEGRTPMVTFIAVALATWLAIVVLVEARATTTPEPVDGWTGALSGRAVETVGAIRQLAFYAAFMRLALVFFGFLLMTWTLLPS